MIKAVLFDYGGVMSSGGKGVEIADRIAANLNVSKEKAFDLLDVGWTLYASGQISEDEFWVQLEKEYGASVPADKRSIWNSWEVMRPKDEMVAFVHQLVERQLHVGLLSNVIPYTMNQIRSHGVYDLFEFTILSAEVGYSKPDPEIYRLALDRLPGLQPDEVIFIDDQEPYLEPAKAIGLHTVRAESSEQIIRDTTRLLEKYGVA